jgi:photosystem II stability/assembly factor-like uncharacterized protein
MRYLSLASVFVSLGFAEGRWVEQENPFTGSATYKDVCFVDSLIGYVLDGYEVVKTTDGGKTWEVQELPGASIENIVSLNDLGEGIKFIDSLRGWIVKYPSETYYTLDGGRTWNFVPVTFPRFLNDVEFVTPHLGWAVGDKGYPPRGGIIHTEDGGKTWVVQDSLRYPGGLYAVTFLDTLKGFAVGDSGLILRTLDGGTHWDSVPSGTKNNLYDIQFADSLHGIIVCRGNALRTTNGGETWEEVTGGAGNDVAFVDTLHAWTAHGYFSIDGGITWKLQEIPGYCYGISFPDTTHGWAVGEYGKIFHYYIPTGIEEREQNQKSEVYSLQIYPNPCSSPVAISYSLLKDSYVSLKIYDAAGKLVRSVVNREMSAGQHKVYWDGKHLPSGVFFLKLEANGLTKGYEKTILIR